MELFTNYPGSYLMTVVLPLVTGIVVAFGGYETLKARAESDAQLNRIEKNIETTIKQLPDFKETLSIIDRYEQTLVAADARDEVLVAVLSQYKKMKLAEETWERLRSSKDRGESSRLAIEILELLNRNLISVSEPKNLPGKPLILGVGANTFRVLFAVPMRISPELAFQELPNGSKAMITEKSKFGFTVVFTPLAIPVTNFSYTANAEL